MRILEYVAANGKNHFKDWFERLPKIIQAKVERRLLRVQLGNLGDVRSLGSRTLNPRGTGLPRFLWK
jgi:putative component of toxin-antitoxin plasmid stabilization module